MLSGVSDYDRGNTLNVVVLKLDRLGRPTFTEAPASPINAPVCLRWKKKSKAKRGLQRKSSDEKVK